MKKKKVRIAIYVRVSTDEQKLKKNSVLAQLEILEEFVKDNPEYILIDSYIDEAVSGTKFNRTELQRLLDDVDAGKIDLIIFTKLDRWFRNINFYYKTQEVLERNNTHWRAILEDYNTLTADGRLKVNIMLSVAQNEAERTSERIKVVFDYKIKHGHAISGSLSYGFKLAPKDNHKIVVHDEDHKPIVYDFLDYFETTQSLHGSMTYINKKYGLNYSKQVYRNILTDPMMYGSYNGNDNYCPPYISKERFERLSAIISNNVRCNTKEGRTYVFSGLMRCPVCGGKMGGNTNHIKRKSGKEYFYKLYICMAHKNYKTCANKKAQSENVIERRLMEELLPQFENMMIESQIQESKPKPKVNKKAILQEIDRLNTMFQKGRISDEKYDKEYEELVAKINDVEVEEPPKKDYSKLKEVLNTDFKTLYETFTDAEKQIFFRSIIESITFDYPTGEMNIKFL